MNSDIIPAEQAEEPKRVAAKRWSVEEEEQLKKHFLAGATTIKLAAMHERSVGAITARLEQMDLVKYGTYNALLQQFKLPDEDETPANSGKPWEEADEFKLLAAHKENSAEKLVALAVELGRSPRSLVLKLVGLHALIPDINPNPQPEERAVKTKEELATKAANRKPKQTAHTTNPATPAKKTKITVTAEFQTAFQAVENGENLLVLGSAGTGKSTFLKWLRHKLAGDKNHVVLAPTGMAALQINGQTIHSFFGFKFGLMEGQNWHRPRSPKIFEKLELIIIDEISMVRADMLDAMDNFLRIYGPKKGQPFGGVQILALGDLFQLPPVVRYDEADFFENLYGTPFFFGSQAWAQGNFGIVEFTEIFRQSDKPFIDILTQIRHGKNDYETLQKLNDRVVTTAPKDTVVLAARNKTVERINTSALAQLKGKAHTYSAKTTGKADAKNFTSPEQLVLKDGARVMFTRNDTNGRWVNGTLGEVVECLNHTVKVKAHGTIHTVEKITWEMTKYALDEDSGTMMSTVAGTYAQLPLTLAWALTIHKAQGQTLESCALDLSDGGAFAEGQLYVALSRARRLESLHLLQPVMSSDVKTSPDVQQFYAALMHA